MRETQESVLPFSGLGFDLTDLLAAPVTLLRCNARPSPAPTFPLPRHTPTPPYGYALLVLLCREIRGR
jgi:hypothetical protein